jgi:hypothetical protein
MDQDRHHNDGGALVITGNLVDVANAGFNLIFGIQGGHYENGVFPG